MSASTNKEPYVLPDIVPQQCAAIAIQYMTPHHPKGDEYTRELSQALNENNYEQAKETTALMCAAMSAFEHPMAAACIIMWEEAFGKDQKPDATVLKSS